MNTYLKHKNFKDIAIKLKNWAEVEGVYVTGDYVNMGFDKTWNINIPCSLILKFEMLGDWLICETDADCIRQEDWKPLISEIAVSK